MTRDMCFSGGRIHIIRDMGFPGRETDITRTDIGPKVGEHKSQGICVFKVGEHIAGFQCHAIQNRSK